MSRPSSPSLLVLHGLRLGAFKPADAVAELVQLPVEVVVAELAAAEAAGLAVYRDGRLSGWSLTPTGRAEGERRLAAELDATSARAEVDACYRLFLACNGPMLALCTDWQLRGPETVNDHSDADYDAAVLARLDVIDDQIQPVCARLGAVLDRFARYGPRLRHARQRLAAGELEWFTRPTIASYHTVWFELHEDLLATLGIDRATEPRPQ